jgi:hypothetical protein
LHSTSDFVASSEMHENKDKGELQKKETFTTETQTDSDAMNVSENEAALNVCGVTIWGQVSVVADP